ncbi:MAG: RiPP maturation radical SAM C-methyltransferase [Candidatus Thorarchaeota archaeon]
MKFSTAIVSMPWSSPEYPSIQIGLLKSILDKENINVYCFHLYLNLLKYIDFDFYKETALLRGGLLGEWIFNKELYFQSNNQSNENDYLEYLSSIGTFKSIGSDFVNKIIETKNNKIPIYLDECENLLSSYNIVGFTCTFNQFLPSLCLASRLKKKNEDTILIFGGAIFDGDFAYEVSKTYPWIDFVFSGEADISFPYYLKKLTTKNATKFDLKKVIINKPLKEEYFKKSPIPDYSQYFSQKEYLKKQNQIEIPFDSILFEASRGCWWAEKNACKFCNIGEQRKIARQKSSKQVVEEIEFQSKKYNINRYFAVEYLSPKNIAQSDSYLNSFIDNKTNFHFSMCLRANLKKNEIRFLSKAGVNKVLVGIETFDSKLLSLMRKGILVIHNLNFLKWMTYYNIRTLYSLLFGIPQENKSNYSNILKRLPLIYHLMPPVNLQQLFLLRNSYYYINKDKLNIEDTVSNDWLFVFNGKDFISGGNSSYSYSTDIFEPPDEIKNLLKKIEKKWIIWKELFYKRKCYLIHYTQNEKIIIEDKRNGLKLKKYSFDSLMKKVYEACNEPNSLHQISKLLEKENQKINIEEIKQSVQIFINLGLIFHEKNLYLNLSFPKDNNLN